MSPGSNGASSSHKCRWRLRYWVQNPSGACANYPYVARVRFGIRVRVRDSAIFEKGECGCSGTRRLKNYLKYFYLYFLYIFTIKIFLKNTYYALIHKKRKKNASFGFSGHIQGRFRPFSDLYRPPADTTRNGRYGPILAESARFGANWNRFGTNWAASAWIESSRREFEEKKKKKKCRRGSTRGQPRRTPRPASRRVASRVVLRRTWVRHLWCRVRAF